MVNTSEGEDHNLFWIKRVKIFAYILDIFPLKKAIENFYLDRDMVEK